MEIGYETIYTKRYKKKKFAVIKFDPSIVQRRFGKVIKSGGFQLIIADEDLLDKLMKKAKEDLSKIVGSEMLKTLLEGIIYDLLAEALVDGVTFELTVEDALYLANLFIRFVDEDFETLREMRSQILLEEYFKEKSDDSNDPSIC